MKLCYNYVNWILRASARRSHNDFCGFFPLLRRIGDDIRAVTMKEFFDKLFSGGYCFSCFANAFCNFGWQDVLDILALSLIFFALYMFVRDRRAGRLVTGIAILLGVYAVSELLDLYALRYAFGIIFGFPVLLVVSFAAQNTVTCWISVGLLAVYLIGLLLFIFKTGNKKK